MAEARRPRGRPKDAGKRAAILDAARALAFGRGPAAVTLEAVAERAGVSRMTVYGHFGDKAALLAAVIAAESAAICGGLPGRLGGGLGGGAEPAADLRADLLAFGTRLVAFLQRPETGAFERLLRDEAARHPELARAFVQHGPAVVVAHLAERLAGAGLAGIRPGLSARNGAARLIGLWRSIETAAAHLGLAPPPGADAIRTHVGECVDLFLRAHPPIETPESRR